MRNGEIWWKAQVRDSCVQACRYEILYQPRARQVGMVGERPVGPPAASPSLAFMYLSEDGFW